MVFNKNAELYSVELQRKEGESLLYVNYLGAPFVPSVADSAEVMSRTVDVLIENQNVSRIIFVQQRNYDYPFEQVSLLVEIAQLYNFLTKQERILSPEKLGIYSGVDYSARELTYLIALLRQDPVGCYLELGKRIRILKENTGGNSSIENYFRTLERFRDLLERTKLIKLIGGDIETYGVGDRSVYKSVFRPNILPNFTFTRLVAQLPDDSDLIDQYEINADNETIVVTILNRVGDSKNLYHVMPPEYSLSEEHHMLLNLGKNVLLQHEPKSGEFTDPEKTRSLFFNVARDLVSELAQNKGIGLNYRELNRLAKILVRQTIGFGLIEVLLMDDKLQDIFLNSPIGQNAVFVRHEKYGECVTNILPSYEDADSWAAKLRLQSGRPLDEANPILDTDLVFGNIRARVAAIQRPLSPQGIAYALRRHREEPWTLPLFINNKMINSFAAGLLSFMIDGSRTLLIAGTRSSGKTSLLGSLMLEIMPKVRTLVIEDTLELPTDALRRIGYNIQRMKVRSALLETTTEVEASEGIRTSLRLGDSALIVGEVRSSEAKALYEAMRVGALANVVAGTIHGASPYGVFDRVVNDLGVQTTSFKATDLILVANPIKTPDGMHSMKRVVQLTEVRKHWLKDPEEEKGFVDLMKYNVNKDELEPTEDLINGDSEIIKSIAGSVKGWAGDWDAVYDNIILRGKIKQEVVDVARKLNMPQLMEAKFNSLSNDMFHRISDDITREIGLPVSERVFPAWKEWMDKAVRKF
ncbi:MAG: ATPase, T2SS/T4P/T4SS family [Candidatus Pacearchaeota archaeon]|nr:ATPase, T2SS/T4P/T4SS family [Candidatus Pacearchaeota archaeon]